ncbi:MAG: hypothetical protein R3F34_15055 [Planctomycetota bacterium]
MQSPDEHPRVDRTPRRTVLVAALLAALLSFAVKLPQWGFTHKEPDELVYWQLAQRLWQDGVYSLRGTLVFERVLQPVAASMYDHPAFHHPPLFAALLGPFAAGDASPYPPASALIVPWLFHALFCAATVALGLRLARARADRVALVLAVAAVVLDPFGWFASRFLWIDALPMGCAAAAMWCALGASSRKRLFAAGTFAALAGLAKLTGLVVLPFVVLLRLRAARREHHVRDLALLVAPSVVLVGAWLVWFANATGAVLPTWLAPTDAILARDELMRGAFERSPLALLGSMALFQPLVFVVGVAFAVRPSDLADRARGVVLAWFVVGAALVLATAVLGATPMLTRQLTAVVPALYALAVAVVVERRAPLWRIAFAACVALAAITGWTSVHGTSVYELAAFFAR